MGINLEQNFSKEKDEVTKDKELFSATDLKEFNDLVKEDADFDILLQGFKTGTILKDINDMEINKQKGGLETSINKEIEKNKDKGAIFTKEYTKLKPEEKDLYEICVLGALLQEQIKPTTTPDLKALAKAYYEKINPIVIEKKNEVVKPSIEGTYATASADIQADTETTINNKTTIENGKIVTEAEVTVSAGADMRIMKNVIKAKNLYDEKISALENMASSFKLADNKKQIADIVAELKSSTKINNISKEKTDNQTGNRYLIGARIAEGFIKTLDNLKYEPETSLKLKIDRDKCKIGDTNSDVPEDRFLNIYLTVKKTDKAANGKEQVKTAPTVTNKQNATNPPKAGDNNAGAGGTTKGGTQVDNDPTGSVSGDQKQGGKGGPNNTGTTERVDITADISGTPISNVETPEIIGLKKDIFEHFSIKGKGIKRETDISNEIIFKDNIYTVSIQGYVGLQFSYETVDTKKQLVLKGSTGGVRKGLFLYDITTQTVAIDSKDKKDIIPTFNETKTIEAVNKQLETNDQDGDKIGDYKAKTIQETSITFEYGVNFIKEKVDPAKPATDPVKPKVDTFVLNIDAANNIIIPDSKEAGQVSQWKKVEGTITKDKDCVFDGTHTTKKDGAEKAGKIVYYTQTSVDAHGIPKLTIINNIQKVETGGYKSVYKEHEEMTNTEFNEIKEDFLTNKIERIFVGTLYETHNQDFQNNWKITKENNLKGRYNFEITFNNNNGTQKKVIIPFTQIIDATTNTRKYLFSDTLIQEVEVDNATYNISTPKTTDGVPSIKMIENKEKTLDNAEKRTSNKVSSDIFSGDKKPRGNDGNKYQVQSPAFSLGKIEFDGKGGYQRTLFLGKKEDGKGNTLLAGEEKGTVYYDKEYKIIHVDIKDDKKEEELNFTDPKVKTSMKNVLENEDGTNKGVVLTPSIVKNNTMAGVQLNFQTPEETDKNRQTTELYLERIRVEKETIFKALKTLSTTLTSNTFILPNMQNNDEVSYNKQEIIGPDGRGLYTRTMAHAYENNLKQSIYCKVEGESLVLCNSDGEKIESTYIIDYKNKEYHKLTIDAANTKNFSITTLNKAEKNKLIGFETEEVAYSNTKVNINMRDDNVELLESNLKDRYTFAHNKHEMCIIYLDADKKLDKKSLEGGKEKPQIIKENDVKFGSYKKFFAGEGREDLGIGENDYKEAFESIYQEESNKDTGKDIMQVKLWSTTDNKYYYDYMEVKQSGNRFSLKKLDGLENAKTEMKRRLDNLVLLNKIQLSAKGDALRGVKINNKDNTSRMAYLKDKNTPVTITLTDTTDKSTNPITITMKDYQRRELTNNTNIDLGTQKINCTLKFKEDIPLLRIEVIEQSEKK